MAEESSGGGGSSLSGLLKKKMGGVPVYVWTLIGILALAFFLKSRGTKKATTEDTTAGTSGASTVPNVTPIAGAMPWSADVFMNQQKQQEAVIPSTVVAGQPGHLADFVNKMNAAYPALNLTEESLMQMNPDMPIARGNSKGFISASNPDAASDPAYLIMNLKPGDKQTVRIR